MRSGANLPAVGGYNQTVILDAIRRAPAGVSRVELAARTGLSAQTISNASRRLLDAGLVVEAGTLSGGVGKPRTILRLQPRGRFAVGIHLDPSVITVVLLDLAATVIAHRTIPTPGSRRAAKTMDRIAMVVAEVTADAGIDPASIMGAGIAAPGPVDVLNGTVLNPPLLSGWENVPVRDELADRLALPVLLEKDVTAAVTAEQWTRTDAAGGNMAFFYYGTGVGIGFVLQNEVIRGSTANAGDIGNMVVGGGGAQADGSASNATGMLNGEGRRWRLGDAVLPRLLVEEGIRRGSLSGPATVLRTAQVRALFLKLADAAHANDPLAIALFDAVAEDIATGLVTVINLLDLNQVIFGGPFWSPVAEFMMARVPRLVRADPHLVSPHSIEFISSAIGQDVAAIGAACLVLDNAFSPRPAGLLIQH